MKITKSQFIRLIMGGYHPRQAEAARLIRTNRNVVLRCGRRFGKTSLLAAELLWYVLRGGRAWWIAPTHALCRAGFVYVKQFVRRLPSVVRRQVRLINSPPFRIEYGSGVAEFFSSRVPDNLQGAGNDLVIIDEAATEPEGELLVEQYIRPTLLDRGGKLIIASTPRGRNWFADYCARPDFVEFVASTYDNPLIDPSEIDQLRDQLSEAAFRQEILAEIVEESGRFWDIQPSLCTECTHIYNEADVCGIDWGYASPFAAIWLKRDGERFVVTREEYGAGLDADEQARRVLAGPKARRYVCDPSTPEQVLRAWRETGLNNVLPASRDRAGGWARMRVLIREGRLVVAESCFNLLREFKEAETDPRNVHDLVGDDHALDALRYALAELHMLQPGKPEPSDPLARFVTRSLRRSGVRI
jgi:hypothetical protein